VLVLAFQLGRWHGLENGTRLKGLNDVHRMGFIEGLDHLDAKALVSAEEHGVVHGAYQSAPLLGSHAGSPDASNFGRDRLRDHCAGGGLLR
jgi:hypothetical protein